MPGTTVRIRQETRESLRELERLSGERPQELLARAVDQFRRSWILAETNAAYGALHEDESAWSDMESDVEAWDATLADGLDEDA